ncbi:MAG: hypothetical protein FWC19_09655 [Treponema sp.]|nr:hypothetical protein [Treponema sp.]MCL2273050.1 hypothetical protein [Treponema sp.]
MKEGIGIFLWKLSVALYLIANGVIGLTKGGGDFKTILVDAMSLPPVIMQIVAVIALVAGIAILLEMFNIQFPFLNTLILIIAIIWAIYVVIGLISWISNTGSVDFWYMLQRLAVHVMVLGSLLIASKRFG